MIGVGDILKDKVVKWIELGGVSWGSSVDAFLFSPKRESFFISTYRSGQTKPSCVHQYEVPKELVKLVNSVGLEINRNGPGEKYWDVEVKVYEY